MLILEGDKDFANKSRKGKAGVVVLPNEMAQFDVLFVDDPDLIGNVFKQIFSFLDYVLFFALHLNHKVINQRRTEFTQILQLS